MSLTVTQKVGLHYPILPEITHEQSNEYIKAQLGLKDKFKLY